MSFDSSIEESGTALSSTAVVHCRPQTQLGCSKTTRNSPTDDTVPLMERRWLTIKEAAQVFPYSETALRHLIFQSEAYQKHPKAGLKSSGFEICITRPPGQRRVLIDAGKFNTWLTGR